MTDLLTHRRYAAARHLLASPSIAIRTRRHTVDGRIDWQGVLADSATMSGGERLLVEIAHRVATGRAIPDSYELSGRLDARNAERVAEAVAYHEEAQQPEFAAAA